jgi:hypothetical protein
VAEEGRTICIMKTEQRAEEIGTEGCGRKGKGDMYNRNGTGAEKNWQVRAGGGGSMLPLLPCNSNRRRRMVKRKRQKRMMFIVQKEGVIYTMIQGRSEEA